MADRLPPRTHRGLITSISFLFLTFLLLGLTNQAEPAENQPVLLFGIGVHIEPFGAQVSPIALAQGARPRTLKPNQMDYNRRPDFERHVADLFNLAAAVELHGGLLTVQAQTAFTTSAIRFGHTILSDFEDSTFDLVINAASTVFVPDVEKVWSEFYRVLKPGGELFAGMMNPSFFLFDHAEAQESGVLEVKHKLPYSDIESLDKKELKRIINDEVPIVWSHCLETLIGSQTKAGFVIVDLYEDWWAGDDTLLNKFSPTTFVTRAKKPEL